VFILKELKVFCFDTLLQVLILKNFYCTKAVQNAVCLARVAKTTQACWQPPENKNASRDAGDTEGEAQYYPTPSIRQK
jgi:hypothetical protein